MVAVPKVIGFVDDFRDYSLDQRRASSDPGASAGLATPAFLLNAPTFRCATAVKAP
jgi:hypothetical protein